MKDIIQDRLSRMEDLEQRKILKQLMTSMFNGVVDYQEKMNRELEQRIFGELGAGDDKNDIFVTVCAREDIDPIHDFLYPMLPGDAKQPEIPLHDIVAGLSRKQECKLLTVFMECSYPELNELLARRRIFQGKMETNRGSYTISARVERSQTYTGEIERLYDVFQKNGIPWKTLNHPYAYKFIDLILTGSDRIPEEDEEIVEISVDLEQYERFKKPDIVPLWNIERLEIRNSGFPVPAADRINYEHVLSLHKTGVGHGYLVDGDEKDVRYIKRSAEDLTVVSPKEASGLWSVWKLTQPIMSQVGKLDYPLFSNRKREGFIGKYARQQSVAVRAVSELMRLVHSFEAADALELASAEVDGKPLGRSGQTYGMNPFISDNIRSESGKKRLKLTFRRRGAAQAGADFVLNDVMSFMVSEIQMHFPEYSCEGEWA
ncbi:normocyte-binding protein [Paenibacillus algorifonticola]|uniref:normocyte-binding protein n=1 Tax=Paenibacillus algorifonticola TaxID=684063 RepID=UPI003D2CDE43